jgi:hypothetical protein
MLKFVITKNINRPIEKLTNPIEKEALRCESPKSVIIWCM